VSILLALLFRRTDSVKGAELHHYLS